MIIYIYIYTRVHTHIVIIIKSKKVKQANLYSALLCPISKALRYDPSVTVRYTVLPATQSPTVSAFTPQLQGVTALWLVLFAPTHKGMARLS